MIDLGRVSEETLGPIDPTLDELGVFPNKRF